MWVCVGYMYGWGGVLWVGEVYDCGCVGCMGMCGCMCMGGGMDMGMSIILRPLYKVMMTT